MWLLHKTRLCGQAKEVAKVRHELRNSKGKDLERYEQAEMQRDDLPTQRKRPVRAAQNSGGRPRRAGKPRDLLRLLCRAHVFLRKLLRMLVFTERHS
jgi:hypothetical protein